MADPDDDKIPTATDGVGDADTAVKPKRRKKAGATAGTRARKAGGERIANEAGAGSPQGSPRVRPLAPEKGRELLGILMLVAGVMLLASLLTYHPDDASWFRAGGTSEGTSNLIGPVGAQVSALAFELVGLTSFVFVVLLLVAGVRRWRQRSAETDLWRICGLVLLFTSLPGLTQLLLGEISWRGRDIATGGALGTLLDRFLQAQVGFLGGFLLLVLTLAAGVSLVVQTTLNEMCLRLWQRSQDLLQDWHLSRERRQERKHKEQARERVLRKHLQRTASGGPARYGKEADSELGLEEAGAQEGGFPFEGSPVELRAPAPVMPLRVTERKGPGSFSVRRVRVGDVDDGFEGDGADRVVPFPVPESTSPARIPAAEEGSAPRAPDTPPPRMPTPSPRRSSQPAAAPATSKPRGQQRLVFAKDGAEPGLPPVNLLQLTDEDALVDENELVRQGETIRARCAEFGVEGTVVSINPGPVITVFEFQPAPGVKVSQIVNLQDELAMALRADSVRIDRLAGRSTLGIEVPNKQRAIIHLGPQLENESFHKSHSPLTLALGVDIGGRPVFTDLATMPHLIVAGATGAGKSVGLQTMITSILYKATREDVQFIFIDPKRIELGVYADIPHLKTEVVVDPKKAANALQWAVAEMERRYRLLAEVHVRSIAYYNQAIQDPEVQKRLSLSDDDEAAPTPQDLKKLPYYVIVIDELADLMMVSSSEVETCIARLAQMARAVGIHLIIATQRPSVDVLTGTIKANFPCRIAFATATRHDSRTILDQVGAEKLLGKGDMLFMPPGTSRVRRLHGAYISEQETAALIRWLKKQGKPELDPDVLKGTDNGKGGAGGGEDNDDELYDEAARLVVAEGQASASFLQRRLRVGFSRAARLIDIMERDGLLGPPQGSKPREVLVPPGYFEEIDRARHDDENYNP